MLGIWTKFGDGELPADGEALVFVQVLHDDIETVLYGGSTVAEIAVHRGGTLFFQGGRSMPIPYGCWWTSLPLFSARA